MPLKVLGRVPLTASCPARIDIGNSLDFPSRYFSQPGEAARTTNIAIELRTTVTWSPLPRGDLRVVLADGTEERASSRGARPSKCPTLWALFRHVPATNGTFRVTSDVPRGSGLGGSGLLLLATLALLRAQRGHRLTSRDWPGLALTVHLFENWLGFSRTGFQDQLAALYGGANTWIWGTHLSPGSPYYRRVALRPPGGAAALEKHLLLCYTGQGHAPTTMEASSSPMTERVRAMWAAVGAETAAFAAAVDRGDWTDAAGRLNAEGAIRRAIDPACVSPRARTLIEAADACGAGARYAGHGHGGCVWACGDSSAVEECLTRWTAFARRWRGAWVRRPRVARRGLIVER